MHAESIYHDWATRALRLGEHVMAGLDLSIYAVTAQVDRYQRMSHFGGGLWLNEPHAVANKLVKTSRSPMVALWKMGELMAQHPEAKTELLTSPIVGLEKSSGWQGAVRVSNRLIACSARPEHHDRLIAATMHLAAYQQLDPRFVRVEKIRVDLEPGVSATEASVIVLASECPRELIERASEMCGILPKMCLDLRVATCIGEAIFIEAVGDERPPKVLGLTVEKL